VTYKDQVLRYLLSGSKSNGELHSRFGGRYRNSICSLRKEGWDIRTDRHGDVCVYSVHPYSSVADRFNARIAELEEKKKQLEAQRDQLRDVLNSDAIPEAVKGKMIDIILSS